MRITRIGLYVNLGMAIAKFIGGYQFNSKALLADAIHSLTDLVSDIMTLATVSWALKPPSERFPAGYGKIESLGSLGVSGILLGSGVAMGWAALSALATQFVPGIAEAFDAVGMHAGHGHSHSHSHTDLGPNINAAWLAAGSIAIKEWLYRATLKVARERKSNVLASNAYHHRVDSLTALVALVLICTSNVFHNLTWLDPVGGLVISLMIVQAGWANTRESFFELADVALDAGTAGRVQRAAESALSSPKSAPAGGPAGGLSRASVRTVHGVKAGQTYLVDVELSVPGAWSVRESRAAEEAVRAGVGAKVRGVKRVRVRFVPGEDAPPPSIVDEFVSAEAQREAAAAEDDDDAHHHGHGHENGHAHHGHRH